ncbi:hypothetical protein [Paracoccus cavernae]|uniref:hypothetical protein n=1 Tax=Paracoccus cavernae TaxID=1571207 RepID=UPI003645A521
MTAYGEFKRLFPVRFRHLKGESAFKRWDWVKFSYRVPTSDRRAESCHVAEESILIDGDLPRGERSKFLDPLISGSAKQAAAKGKSLALLRPRSTEFYYRRKSEKTLESERNAYKKAVSQGSFLDDPLEAIEPTPYHFKFRFIDDDGRHDYTNADWELHAWFFRLQRELGNDQAALDMISQKMNGDYPRNGMMFAIGNIAKRPQVWQLLGVLRVDHQSQSSLF